MKQISKLMYLLLLALLSQACKEEDKDLTQKRDPEKVQFTISLSSLADKGGRVNTTTLPTNTSAVVSIESSTGTSVLTNEKITLLNFGGSYITSPLELPPGKYKLNDFMLVNDSSRVLYATPKAGSPLAGAVTHALPYTFTVIKSNVSNIAMEVLDIGENSPEDFGYVSFGVSIVHPLRISVFIPDGNKMKLTTATAYILKGNDTLSINSLKAAVNIFPFKQDVNDTYTLEIIKDGYTRFAKEFNYNDLTAELSGSPLQVTLAPAFTIVARVSQDEDNTFYFDLFLDTSLPPFYHFVSIDWGDGTPPTPFTIDISSDVGPGHLYEEPGDYFVSITGEIDKITYFGLSRVRESFGYGEIRRFNTDHLTTLTYIDFTLRRLPAIIDLSHNPGIKYITLIGADGLTNLILPTDNKIIDVDLSGSISLTVESINDIIKKIHDEVVADDRRNGVFRFDVAPFINTGIILGPPSDERLNDLYEMRDNYDWYIWTDPSNPD